MSSPGGVRHIRSARSVDLPAMVDIETASAELFRGIGMVAVADDPPPSIEDLGVYQRASRAIVAVQEDVVIGYLTWEVLDGRLHVEQVTVDPRFSRRGVGAALIEHASRTGRSRGIDEVSLTTFEQVPWNAPYYSRLGFAVLSRERLGAQLAARMDGEAARGLDAWPRVAMVRRSTDPPEVPLAGGDVTDGIVRVGASVRRPRGTASEVTRQVLQHLESVGFDGAPTYLRVDDKGRDVLSYVEGEVVGRPWPVWVQDETRITSLAQLVRRLDDAMLPLGIANWAADIERPQPAGIPARAAGDPQFLAHLDITPENVVFDHARAAALIDFDMTASATRAEEVANLPLWWAPWMPPEDREPALMDVDERHRARLIVDAYGLEAADRDELVPLSINIAARAWHLMRWRSDRLGGGWRRMWDAGVGERIRRREAWLRDHEPTLRAAVSTNAGPCSSHA